MRHLHLLTLLLSSCTILSIRLQKRVATRKAQHGARPILASASKSAESSLVSTGEGNATMHNLDANTSIGTYLADAIARSFENATLTGFNMSLLHGLAASMNGSRVEPLWFNALLKGLWPWLNGMATNYLTDANSPLLRLLHGSLTSSARFDIPKNGPLGTNPLRILEPGDARIIEPIPKRGIHIHADVQLETNWGYQCNRAAGDQCELSLNLGVLPSLNAPITLNVVSLKITGPLVVRLEPILDPSGAPFGGVMVYFTERPQAIVSLSKNGAGAKVIGWIDSYMNTGPLKGMADWARSRIGASVDATPVEEKDEFHNEFLAKQLENYLVLPSAITKAFGTNHEIPFATNRVRPLGILQISVAKPGDLKVYSYSSEKEEPFDMTKKSFFVTVLGKSQPIQFALNTPTGLRVVKSEPAKIDYLLGGTGIQKRLLQVVDPVATVEFSYVFYPYRFEANGLQGIKPNPWWFLSDSDFSPLCFLRAKIERIVLTQNSIASGEVYGAVELIVYKGAAPTGGEFSARTSVTRETLQEELIVAIGEDDGQTIEKHVHTEWLSYRKAYGSGTTEKFFKDSVKISSPRTKGNKVPFEPGLTYADYGFPLKIWAMPEKPGKLRHSAKHSPYIFSYAEHKLDFQQSLYLPIHTHMFEEAKGYKLLVRIHTKESFNGKSGAKTWDEYSFNLYQLYKSMQDTGYSSGKHRRAERREISCDELLAEHGVERRMYSDKSNYFVASSGCRIRFGFDQLR